MSALMGTNRSHRIPLSVLGDSALRGLFWYQPYSDPTRSRLSGNKVPSPALPTRPQSHKSRRDRTKQSHPRCQGPLGAGLKSHSSLSLLTLAPGTSHPLIIDPTLLRSFSIFPPLTSTTSGVHLAVAACRIGRTDIARRRGEHRASWRPAMRWCGGAWTRCPRRNRAFPCSRNRRSHPRARCIRPSLSCASRQVSVLTERDGELTGALSSWMCLSSVLILFNKQILDYAHFRESP